MTDNPMMNGALESGAGSIAESFDRAIERIAEPLPSPGLAERSPARGGRPAESR